MSDVLIRLRQKLPQMTSKEREIAEVVLANPNLVVESTITELARACEVSPGSVARMCRTAGFRGYRDFRIDMASTVGREENNRAVFRVSDAEIAANDTVADVIAKVAYQEIKAIEDTARVLDHKMLDGVTETLRDAGRIDLFGVGSSGLITEDLHQKLHRIGLTSFSWTDIHLAITSVAIASPGSVAFGVSHTGTTQETLHFLNTARQRGARTIAITNFPDSPIGKVADYVLTTSSHDTGVRAGAMASRIAQMAVVDFLLVRLVQRLLPGAEELLRESYAAIEGLRVPWENSNSER